MLSSTRNTYCTFSFPKSSAHMHASPIPHASMHLLFPMYPCISYSPCMHASPTSPIPGGHGWLIPFAPGSVHAPFAVLVMPSVHTNIPTFPLPVRVHWYLHTPVLASTRAYLGCLQTLQSVLRAQLMLPHLNVQTIDSTSRRRSRLKEKLLSHILHCQSSALKSPPLRWAMFLPISAPDFLNTSTLPLSGKW